MDEQLKVGNIVKTKSGEVAVIVGIDENEVHLRGVTEDGWSAPRDSVKLGDYWN